MNLVATLIGWGVPEKFAKPLLYAAGAIALLLVVWAAVKIHDRGVIDKHEQKLEQRAAPATNKAADERAADTVRTTKDDQERHDVIAAQPDQPIAPTSHALACKRLRDAGKHPASCG